MKRTVYSASFLDSLAVFDTDSQHLMFINKNTCEVEHEIHFKGEDKYHARNKMRKYAKKIQKGGYTFQ